MKKLASTKKVFVLLMLILLMVFVFAASYYKVNDNQTVKVDEWGVCKNVENTGCPGSAIFVPTNTSNEWSLFRSYHPSCVVLSECGAPNGEPCSVGSDCLSGYCVDGVCCNSACNGTCESCNQSGSVGTCTPYPAGTDPENECSPSGYSCVNSCRMKYFPGTCDGDSAACENDTYTYEYCASGEACISGSCRPGACDTSWHCYGSSYCQYTCDGSGNCNTNYNCDDCSDCSCSCGGYNVTESAANGNCADGKDNDCDGYTDTADSGCPCTDNDGDGYYVESYCPGSPDCCDSDPDAHPGQTNYFTTADNCGNFDYDCDGVEELYPSFQTLSTLSPFPFSCTTTCPSGHPGWATSVPDCGQSGTFENVWNCHDSSCDSGCYYNHADILNCTPNYYGHSFVSVTYTETQKCH